MKTKLVEPVSRKLNVLGQDYLAALNDHLAMFDIDRHFYPLTLIHRNDGQLTQKALAEILGKDKSLIVKIIDRLSEKGFVYRTVNPEDRREHFLSATDKAREVVPHIIKTFEHMNQSASKGISAHDMEIFENVLLKMRDNLADFAKKQTATDTIKP
ncbi:MarR family transcriptional regulator [Mucilaginibacter sp. dw_454]|uniref:MarR family winged helix-turn-helix transcriptional regulator n=1 Tax=Mucilaginibacter sp. dw_454 TaxID=2720079 RepID=UPI001BD2A326|nr:MarR family transcriptional regulator [Mucilaginibacter sp. dw_454]